MDKKEEELTEISIKVDSLRDLIRHDLQIEFGYRVDSRGNASLGDLSKVFELLDLSREDTSRILELLKKTSEKLREQELRNVKVVSVSENRITLDTSGMRAPAEALRAEINSEILRVLPDLKGQLLVDSLNWEYFYREGADGKVKLGISRTQSIELNPHETRENITRSIDLEDPDLPNDGSSLPADRVFGQRWKPFLKVYSYSNRLTVGSFWRGVLGLSGRGFGIGLLGF